MISKFFLPPWTVCWCFLCFFTAQHNYKVNQVWGGSAISPEINKTAIVRERCQHGKHVSNNEDVNHGINNVKFIYLVCNALNSCQKLFILYNIFLRHIIFSSDMMIFINFEYHIVSDVLFFCINCFVIYEA